MDGGLPPPRPFLHLTRLNFDATTRTQSLSVVHALQANHPVCDFARLLFASLLVYARVVVALSIVRRCMHVLSALGGHDRLRQGMP